MLTATAYMIAFATYALAALVALIVAYRAWLSTLSIYPARMVTGLLGLPTGARTAFGRRRDPCAGLGHRDFQHRLWRRLGNRTSSGCTLGHCGYPRDTFWGDDRFHLGERSQSIPISSRRRAVCGRRAPAAH